MRIAILDDDLAFCDLVARLMSEVGHEVRQFGDVSSILSGLRQEYFHLLMLNWTLPDPSGLGVLTWVKQNLRPAPPTILITARSADADIVSGLTQGADDYIVKPLGDDVLKARIDALLRRVYPSAAKRGVERFGQHAFDLQSRRVTVAGAQVATTAKEFALALLLFRNLDRPLPRAYIFEVVWGPGAKVTGRTLDAHISKIRSRLKLRPDHGLRLSSIYNFGYLLVRF